MAVTQDQLYDLYLAYFGRPPDFDGLQFYTANPNFTMASVAAAFSASPESQALYGSSFGAAQVDAIYMNLFNRHAEPAGLAYWTTEVASGRITPAGAALAILQGAQNDDKIAVQNKLAIAHAFVADLDTSEEIIGYSGPIAAAAARAFLHTVDWTAGSLTAAQANLDASVAAVVGVGGPPGQNFTLTTSVDHIVGTAGNDVIEAIPAGSSTTDQSSLNSFDTIDGGGGTDTLNIYVVQGEAGEAVPGPPFFIPGTASANTMQQGTVKNVEIVNIYNDQGQFGDGEGWIDAAGFQGLQQLWQRGVNESNVWNVTSTTVLGFADNDQFLAPNIEATAATAAVNIKLDNIGWTEGGLVGWLDVSGDSLNQVNITGSLTDAANNYTGLDLGAGVDVQSVSVNSSVAVQVEIEESSDSVKHVTTFDATGAGAGVSFDAYDSVAAGQYISTIKTGVGDDYVNVTTITVKDDATTTKDETVNAVVTTGDGDDFVDVGYNVPGAMGTGTITIDVGAGDDEVDVYQRSSGKLTVNLGAGDDQFYVYNGQVINGTDAVDGGAGSDLLLLSLVGAANIGAFSNFEVFDAYNMAKILDVDILASKNTVTEIVASGDVGDAVATTFNGSQVTNLGAGVGFRATEDMGTSNVMGLTQKAAGAISVTSDIDQSAAAADDVADTVHANALATNASSIAATFGNDFVDNVTSIMNLTGTAATSLTIASGGTNSTNVMNYAYGETSATGAPGALTSVTVTGAEALQLNLTDAVTGTDAKSSVATVDASALTGNFTFDMGDLKGGGSVKTGTGVDLLTVTSSTFGTAAGATMKSVVGFEKAAAAAFSASPGTTIADSDKLVITGATIGATDATADANGVTVAGGVVGFAGTGPSTFTQAVTWVDLQAGTTAGTTLVFQYLGDTYVFVEGGTAGIAANDDTVVKLTGVTGVTKVAEIGTTDQIILG